MDQNMDETKSKNNILAKFDDVDDRESQSREEKPKYPKSIAFIIGNEFCERFSYYGMRTILILYFVQRLGYNENSATMAFHVFAMACYFTPLLGAILADSYLGRYKTILIISCIYAAGSVIISLAAFGGSSFLSLLGLGFIALGTGGIKPCVSAFGGDQFLPSQEKELQRFFSFFYIAINCGGLLSTFLTPILREDVGCQGRNDCYPLAFGVPALLMIISLSLFVLGKIFVGYNELPPQRDNVIIKVCRCIFTALRGKISKKSGLSKEHWLDYAEPEFDRQTISEVKVLMRILFICIPLPMFWALLDQQSSRWTLQAIRMNGKIGNFVIKPDQIQVINPVLIVVLIPVFDYVIYPLLEKINFNKPLRKMVIGGLLAGMAFFVCTIIQVKLESEAPAPMQSNHNHLLIINGDKKKLNLDDNLKILNITGLISGYHSKLVENVPRPLLETLKTSVSLVDDQTMVLYYDKTMLQHVFPWENIKTKPSGSGAKIYTVFHLENYQTNQTFSATDRAEDGDIKPKFINNDTTFGVLEPPFEVDIKGKPIFISVGEHAQKFTDLGQGTTHLLLISGDMGEEKLHFQITQLVDENQYSVFLQVFQYAVITAGEIMFSVTGLEFFYSESPESMKSVMQATWLLTVSFGDLIVAIIAELGLFSKQSYEFIFFGVLMCADMVLFAWMAYSYIPNHQNNENKNSDS